MKDNATTGSIYCKDCDYIVFKAKIGKHECTQFNQRLRVSRERLVSLPVKCKPCYEVSTINPNVD